MSLWRLSGAEGRPMAQVFDFSAGTATPAGGQSRILVPARFQETVDRHQKNIIALSTALRTAGMTPDQAAGYVDAALASFCDGLATTVGKFEDPGL